MPLLYQKLWIVSPYYASPFDTNPFNNVKGWYEKGQ